MLGNAILYSVNYDRRVNNTWTGRLGANALLGRGTHRLELGPFYSAKPQLWAGASAGWSF